MKKYSLGQPSITEAEIAAVVETMRSGWITQGRKVEEFEDKFARLLGVEHAVMCSSGTSALHLALATLGLGPGDEVLVPDLTYVATVNAVVYVGATPVLVDVEPTTWGLCVEDAEHAVSSRTKAIIVTHLYGVPCNMAEVMDFAQRHGLTVVEDASEALGTTWRGDPCGTLGLCGTFSFYGNKIITTGEGGAVVTNDAAVAETLRFLRGQAQSPIRRFWHSEVGFNFRMTDVHASIGLAQLTRYPEFLHERRRVIKRYLGALHPQVITTPMIEASAPWLFTGLLPNKILYHVAAERLEARGIEVRPVFTPMHRLPMYARPDTQFPISCLIGEYGISLPTHPGLTNEDVDEIAAAVRACAAAPWEIANV